VTVSAAQVRSGITVTAMASSGYEGRSGITRAEPTVVVLTCAAGLCIGATVLLWREAPAAPLALVAALAVLAGLRGVVTD
jgi:hypothetical protein